MTPRPWEPEAVALRRAERRQRRALLIAGGVTAIVVLLAVVVAIVADDDEPGAQGGGATTLDSTPGRTAVTTATRSSTTARRSTTTTTAIARSTTTQPPGASSSSAVPSSTGGQGATTVVGQTTIDSPTSGAPSPSPVPPVDDASTTTSTTTATSPTAAPGTTDNPVRLGTAAAIGEGWNFTVSAYVPDATKEVLAEDEFNEAPPDGFQYALAAVAATYDGTDPTTSMFDVDVGVISPSDFETDMFSCPVLVPNELDTSIEVSPGDTVTGNVCFMLPTAEATTVVIYATAGFVNDDVYFALA